ncbi:MAG: SDR family oxidoreductase [Balneolaceae bacterium]|nr:SDR family oxidoreductase [Balneolaceae bacterium]
MRNFSFELTGKLALVTGGGTGLGFGISKAFIKAGCDVVITGRRKNVLEAACKELGNKAKYIVNDITDLNLLSGLVDKIEDRNGPVDILVNNAGINQKKDVLDVTNGDFEKILRTNLNGVFALSREVGRKMIERQSGSIINITSMAAIYGIPKVSAYSASKAGVLGLTRSLAADFSPHGISVNAIAPGFIESPMLRKAFNSDPDRKRRVLERTLMRKLGSPEDVAYAAVYLASDASEFITGIQLPVDGGNSIGF